MRISIFLHLWLLKDCQSFHHLHCILPFFLIPDNISPIVQFSLQISFLGILFSHCFQVIPSLSSFSYFSFRNQQNNVIFTYQNHFYLCLLMIPENDTISTSSCLIPYMNFLLFSFHNNCPTLGHIYIACKLNYNVIGLNRKIMP